MLRTKPPYPPEFRREAAELVRVSGNPIAQVASYLGVSIRPAQSVKQADVDAGKRDGLTSEEREDVRRLRRENGTHPQKAAAFFSRESEGR